MRIYFSVYKNRCLQTIFPTKPNIRWCYIMTVEVIGALASALVLVLGSFFAFTKWIIMKFLSELKPNSGSSIKDKVEINSERLFRVEQRVDDIYEILAKKG